MPSRAFTVGEEKSIPSFQDSKDRSTLFLEANAASDLKLKPMFIDLSKNLKNNNKATLPVLCDWNNKAWMTGHHGLLNILSPLLRTTAQKKRFL